jgi:hypothetical protein
MMGWACVDQFGGRWDDDDGDAWALGTDLLTQQAADVCSAVGTWDGAHGCTEPELDKCTEPDLELGPAVLGTCMDAPVASAELDTTKPVLRASWSAWEDEVAGHVMPSRAHVELARVQYAGCMGREELLGPHMLRGREVIHYPPGRPPDAEPDDEADCMCHVAGSLACPHMGAGDPEW